MTVKAFQGKEPDVADAAFVADNAAIIGDVTVGKDSSVWYSAVMRGDYDSITVGEGTSIQDLTMVHTATGFSTKIGNRVTIGHSCVIHGCTIEDECLIGMGAIIMDGAVIGKGCIIAAGAVVKQNAEIPPLSLVAGVPGEIKKTFGPAIAEKNVTHAQTYVEFALAHAVEED